MDLKKKKPNHHSQVPENVVALKERANTDDNLCPKIAQFPNKKLNICVRKYLIEQLGECRYPDFTQFLLHEL